jgi:outer membrane biosynthesis protein TonB
MKFEPPRKRAHQQESFSTGVAPVTAPTLTSNNSDSNGLPSSSASVILSRRDVSALLDKYVRAVRDQILSKWSPPKSTNPVTLTVFFRVHRPGHISILRLEYSSGSPAIDRAALEAVQKSVPFSRVPDELPDFLDLQLVLEPDYGNRNRSEVYKQINRLSPPARQDRR